jgi:hypothetical protein
VYLCIDIKEVKKMEKMITIKGKPVIQIWESIDGSYWYITEYSHKQDSVIKGRTYKDDQIMFGYVRLSHCPQFAEWGYISKTELELLKPKVWQVEPENWAGCPLVELKEKPGSKEPGVVSFPVL